MPDADFVFIHDSQTPSYVDVLEIEQRSPNCLTDPLLGGGMHLQPNDAESLLGWESHHVGEIGIQRHEHTTVLDREAQDLFVGRSCEVSLKDRDSVVPFPFSVRLHVVERGSHPEKASLDCEDDLIGCKTCRIFKAGLDVLRLELRVCGKDDLARFTGGQLFQNQIDRNSSPFEAGLPQHHIRPGLNEFGKRHHCDFIRDSPAHAEARFALEISV